MTLFACACENCQGALAIPGAILAAVAFGGVVCLTDFWINRRQP
jgi:hypothetical protein